MIKSVDAYEVRIVEKVEEFTEVMKQAFELPDIFTTEKIEDKQQFRYLTSYLFTDPDGLKIKTIVIENEYSSIPYMADYINYYAHCYANYTKNCRRIHFFKRAITPEEFTDMIVAKQNEDYWAEYAGYIVVKPLPAGFIGPTVLETYSNKNKTDRFFSAIKTYHINLFGRDLEKQTLQYQEQDGIVGSCASAAAGFAFHKTNELFGTAMPSPSEITLLAGSDSHLTGKIFPNTEMTIPQICRAISATGLFSELVDDTEYLNEDTWFNACAHAYLKSGIPLLLGLDIQESRRSHLITLNGYRLGKKKPLEKDEGGLQLEMISDSIIKFYAHDDQLGPFTRLEIIDDLDRKHHFRTSYWKSPTSSKYKKADPVTLIIPLKTSIKVFFDNILDEAVVLSTLLKRPKMEDIPYVWDIFLIKSNAYKKEIRDEMAASEKEIIEGKDVLFKSLPQYIWVIRSYYKGAKANHLLFDLIYDAIDVNFKGNPYYSQIFNESYQQALRKTGILNELSVFKRYQDITESTSQLFTITSEDTSVLEFLEDVEGDTTSDEKSATTSEYLKILNDKYKKQFSTEISNQKKSIDSQIDQKDTGIL